MKKNSLSLKILIILSLILVALVFSGCPKTCPPTDDPCKECNTKTGDNVDRCSGETSRCCLNKANEYGVSTFNSCVSDQTQCPCAEGESHCPGHKDGTKDISLCCEFGCCGCIGGSGPNVACKKAADNICCSVGNKGELQGASQCPNGHACCGPVGNENEWGTATCYSTSTEPGDIYNDEGTDLGVHGVECCIEATGQVGYKNSASATECMEKPCKPKEVYCVTPPTTPTPTLRERAWELIDGICTKKEKDIDQGTPVKASDLRNSVGGRNPGPFPSSSLADTLGLRAFSCNEDGSMSVLAGPETYDLIKPGSNQWPETELGDDEGPYESLWIKGTPPQYCAENNPDEVWLPLPD